MNPNAWSIFVNVLAIVILLICTLTLALASAVTVWSLRRIDKSLAPGMAAMVAMEKPLAKMVETLENVSEAASELKDLQEGNMRVVGALVKSANEFRATVEEFHAAVFAGPETVRRRRPGPTGVDEQDEIEREKRTAEGNGNRTAGELAELLEQRGKHGGVV